MSCLWQEEAAVGLEAELAQTRLLLAEAESDKDDLELELEETAQVRPPTHNHDWTFLLGSIAESTPTLPSPPTGTRRGSNSNTGQWCVQISNEHKSKQTANRQTSPTTA